MVEESSPIQEMEGSYDGNLYWTAKDFMSLDEAKKAKAQLERGLVNPAEKSRFKTEVVG